MHDETMFNVLYTITTIKKCTTQHYIILFPDALSECMLCLAYYVCVCMYASSNYC